MNMSDHDTFDAKLATFVAGAQAIIDADVERQVDDAPDYQAADIEELLKRTLSTEHGRRYVRVVVSDKVQRSAFCFVDKTNGNVLKPASWKSPAKHARGNIFDDNNGLGLMGPYGPAYLRG